MSKRSKLVVAQRKHIDPTRGGEDTIVEVWRDGELVAHIYGTRDGVQVVSDRLDRTKERTHPYALTVRNESKEVHSVVVPLLAPDETCPLCVGTKVIHYLKETVPCWICAPEV